MTSPLEERRQRVREAYYDACGPGRPEGSAIALEGAIETATRVRTTPEIIAAAMTYIGMLADDEPAFQRGLKAAFEAAGFEVEQ